MFEGIEKKFEILVPNGHPSLRTLGDDVWTRVVERSRASLLSTITNEYCTAHLLSESSLFVFDRRAVMITCGQTSLVAAVQELIKHVKKTRLQSFIYERKNENFPQLQPSTFEQDASTLTRIFKSGVALQFGDPRGHHLSLFHLDKHFEPASDDTTVEVLMYGLDPELAYLFIGNDTGIEENRDRIRGKIVNLLPGFDTDDHFFEPHGYSLNGIHGPHYFTVHVTPEDPGSYVSFETNAPLGEGDLGILVRRLVGLFRPERFDLAVFQSGARVVDLGDAYLMKSEENRDLDCGYHLRFSHFVRRGARSPRTHDAQAPDAAHRAP